MTRGTARPRTWTRSELRRTWHEAGLIDAYRSFGVPVEVPAEFCGHVLNFLSVLDDDAAPSMSQLGGLCARARG